MNRINSDQAALGWGWRLLAKGRQQATKVSRGKAEGLIKRHLITRTKLRIKRITVTTFDYVNPVVISSVSLPSLLLSYIRTTKDY